MVQGEPPQSVDIWGGQWGSLVENGAQNVLGRRTIKSRVLEGESARCGRDQVLPQAMHSFREVNDIRLWPRSLPTLQHYLCHPGDLPDWQPVSPPQSVDPTQVLSGLQWSEARICRSHVPQVTYRDLAVAGTSKRNGPSLGHKVEGVRI